MTGVLYNGDYTKMTDFQVASVAQASSQDFIDALMRNKSRQNVLNKMEIIFSGAALTVKINGETVYSDANAGLTLGQFAVQSHWDSGVIFSNMKVIESGN